MSFMQKLPTRMCAGCRVRKSKNELVRVVRDPHGVISIDTTLKKDGRGVYICVSSSCLKAAAKARRFERSLSGKIPVEVYELLEKEFAAKEVCDE